MNIVDVLAIMPYYVSLFLLNDGAITPPEDGVFSTPDPSEIEDEGGSVEGILQVKKRLSQSEFISNSHFPNF